MRSPGRREIGHGKLAWRAIRPLLPPRESFPYTIRVVSEITESQRLELDGDGLRQLAGADGRRRADRAAGRRHRHGPDQGGRALRRPVRHPRRRGPSRRHGLQGRRHRARRHLAADGHQDRRHHRGDHGARRCTQARDGRLHILGEMAKGISGARPEMREIGAADQHDPDPAGQDRRGDRPGRQDDPRDLRDHRAPRSTSRTTARSRSPRPTPWPASRRSTGSAA